jgi:sterol desaturase/sphingolipid hydroxylase (fatty acid hydroxylase superfamily)
LERESREKKENRRYLKMGFLMPVIVISLVWVAITVSFLAMSAFNVLAMLKGAAFTVLAWLGYLVYKRYSPAYQQWKRSRIQGKKYAAKT